MKHQLPILNVNKDESFSVKKPKGCSFCSLQSKVGYVADGLYNDTALNAKKLKGIKMVIVQDMPSKDEANQSKPLSGPYGYARWKRFLEKTGWQQDEVGFSYLRRCYAGVFQGKPMISAAEQADAVKKCRQYDYILENFKPDVAVITHAFYDSINIEAFYRMTLADLSKAKMLVDKGIRPVLLLGDEARRYYLPSLKGGTKQWAGSWFELQ